MTVFVLNLWEKYRWGLNSFGQYIYHNDFKYWDRQVWANSADPDQTAPHVILFASFEHAPGRVAQSVGHLTRKSGVLGSIPGLATYFRFSFRFFKKGSCQLLAKVCARSTG